MNNREIKFRAWVDAYGTMEMVYSYCFLNKSDNHFYAVDLTNERPDISKIEQVMQFTGIKDSSGSEIYEGDINQHGEVVIFCNECNGYQFALYDFPTKEFIFCHNCEGNFMFQDGLSDIKIIGNIYENPELLNK